MVVSDNFFVIAITIKLTAKFYKDKAGEARLAAAVLATPIWHRRFGDAPFWRRTLWRRGLAPDTLAPRVGAGHFGAAGWRRTLWRRTIFFFGTNLPKTGRVITLTETDLNSNQNGS